MVTRLRSGFQLCTKYIMTHHMITIPVIPKSQWQGPHCVLFCALTAVSSILASVLLRVPPLKFTSLLISLPPTLLPFSSPSFLHSLYPSPLSFAPSMATFLPHSFPSSTFPPFLHSRSHPPSHHRFLTPSRCSLPLLSPCSLPPSLPPILHPASLLPCHPPCLSAYLRRIIECTTYVVSGQQLNWVYCVVGSSQAWQWDNGGVVLAAVTFSVHTPTTNPFLTNSKKSDDRNVQQTHINTVHARTFPRVHAATLWAS